MFDKELLAKEEQSKADIEDLTGKLEEEKRKYDDHLNNKLDLEEKMKEEKEKKIRGVLSEREEILIRGEEYRRGENKRVQRGLKIEEEKRIREKEENILLEGFSESVHSHGGR